MRKESGRPWDTSPVSFISRLFPIPLEGARPHLCIKGVTNESLKVGPGMSSERIASTSGRYCADERQEQMNIALITNGPGRRRRPAKVRASEMSNLFLR